MKHSDHEQVVMPMPENYGVREPSQKDAAADPIEERITVGIAAN
jgi:hypothetical protein